MFRITFLLMAAFSLSASAGSMRAAKSMTIDFASLGSGIADSTLRSVNTLISMELADGKIKYYSNSSYGLEGETTICVEASHNTLFRLEAAIDLIPVPAGLPRPVISLSDGLCPYLADTSNDPIDPGEHTSRK